MEPNGGNGLVEELFNSQLSSNLSPVDGGNVQRLETANKELKSVTLTWL